MSDNSTTSDAGERSDPMEALIAQALTSAGVGYSRDLGGGNPSGLDFRLDNGVEIEVKRFHSPRIAEQMGRAPDVIAAQGEKAVRFLADALSRPTEPTAPTSDTGPAVRSAAFAVLRRHNVSEGLFAEVAAATHEAMQHNQNATDVTPATDGSGALSREDVARALGECRRKRCGGYPSNETDLNPWLTDEDRQAADAVLALLDTAEAALRPAVGEVEARAEQLFRAFMAGDTNKLTTTALPNDWPSLQLPYRQAWIDLAAALASPIPDTQP